VAKKTPHTFLILFTTSALSQRAIDIILPSTIMIKFLVKVSSSSSPMKIRLRSASKLMPGAGKYIASVLDFMLSLPTWHINQLAGAKQ
jgi:uncharacterized protein YybS (DUF2232 family)